MKIYFNGFWNGFIDKTDPVNCTFFLDLFKKVFNVDCFIGDINDSNIICESVFGTSHLTYKKWDYSFYFSGESYTRHDISKYNVVLFGQRNHKNIINCPLFIPYLYCNNKINYLENYEQVNDVPKKEIVAIISNPNGIIRNYFLNELEKKFNITYAGKYKNNIGYNIHWIMDS